jgi:hypothetical protein
MLFGMVVIGSILNWKNPMKIDFEISKDGLVFKDSISLPKDHGLSTVQIEAIKQQRFDDWYALINAPSTEEVTEE